MPVGNVGARRSSSIGTGLGQNVGARRSSSIGNGLGANVVPGTRQFRRRSTRRLSLGLGLGGSGNVSKRRRKRVNEQFAAHVAAFGPSSSTNDRSKLSKLATPTSTSTGGGVLRVSESLVEVARKRSVFRTVLLNLSVSMFPFFGGTTFMVIGALFSQLQTQFGLADSTSVGVLISANAIAAALSTVFLGPLADHWGINTVALLVLALTLLGNGLTAVASVLAESGWPSAYAVLFVSRVIHGLGNGPGMLGAIYLTRFFVGSRRFSVMVALNAVATETGYGFALLAFPAIGVAWGVSMALFVNFLVAVVALLAWTVVVVPEERAMALAGRRRAALIKWFRENAVRNVRSQRRPAGVRGGLARGPGRGAEPATAATRPVRVKTVQFAIPPLEGVVGGAAATDDDEHLSEAELRLLRSVSFSMGSGQLSRRVSVTSSECPPSSAAHRPPDWVSPIVAAARRGDRSSLGSQSGAPRLAAAAVLFASNLAAMAQAADERSGTGNSCCGCARASTAALTTGVAYHDEASACCVPSSLPSWRSLLGVLRSFGGLGAVFWLATVVFFLSRAVNAGVGGFGESILSEEFGWTSEDAGALLSPIGLVTAVVAPPVGLIFDRFGGLISTLVMAGALAAAGLTMWQPAFGLPPQLALGVVALAGPLALVAARAIVPMVVPAEQWGTAFGLNIGIGSGAALIVPLVMAPLRDSTGNYSASLWFLAALGFCMFLVGCALKLLDRCRHTGIDSHRRVDADKTSTVAASSSQDVSPRGDDDQPQPSLLSSKQQPSLNEAISTLSKSISDQDSRTTLAARRSQSRQNMEVGRR